MLLITMMTYCLLIVAPTYNTAPHDVPPERTPKCIGYSGFFTKNHNEAPRKTIGRRRNKLIVSWQSFISAYWVRDQNIK